MLYYTIYWYIILPVGRIEVCFMKIVVLAGGLSTERNVALTSGTGICRALRRLGHKAVLVDMFLGQIGRAHV